MWMKSKKKIVVKTDGVNEGTTVELTDGNWHHIVEIIDDDGKSKVYVDGMSCQPIKS